MEQRVVLGVSVGISQNGVHEEMPQQPLALFQRVGGIAGQQLGNALIGRIAFRGRRCCRVLASRFYAESLRAVFLMQPDEPPSVSTRSKRSTASVGGASGKSQNG